MDELTYAYYPAFAAASGRRGDGGWDVEQDVEEARLLFDKWADRVTLRGTYSTVGFRPDVDVMMWWVAHSPEDVQDLLVELRRTGLGRRLEQRYAFMGVVRPAEFSRDHVPAFLRGGEPLSYLCVYPFVRDPEWYLLPPEERGAMLGEHGEIGRQFPDVLANTTSAFGLNDWEWILAFESDRLDRLVDCIRRLREARARRFTKEEVPFVTGIRRDLADAVRAMA